MPPYQSPRRDREPNRRRLGRRSSASTSLRTSDARQTFPGRGRAKAREAANRRVQKKHPTSLSRQACKVATLPLIDVLRIDIPPGLGTVPAQRSFCFAYRHVLRAGGMRLLRVQDLDFKR
jgi:hypothetical protein